jgi:hypothetical protein
LYSSAVNARETALLLEHLKAADENYVTLVAGMLPTFSRFPVKLLAVAPQ